MRALPRICASAAGRVAVLTEQEQARQGQQPASALPRRREAGQQLDDPKR